MEAGSNTGALLRVWRRWPEDSLLLLHAVGLLCGLAAAAFATVVRGRYGALAVAAGFLIGIAWLQPGPGWTGAVVAATAGLLLVRPGGTLVSLAASLVAGLAGGLWSRVLGVYGLPLWLACLPAFVVIAFAAVSSSRNPRFAAPSVREDALAALGVLGLAIAAAPGVAAGWRAARAMNLAAGDIVRPGVHPGVVLGFAAVVALGGLHTLWRRG